MKFKVLLVLLIFPFFGFSQQVTFCEKVDDRGQAINKSDRFSISKDGGAIKILVYTKKNLNSRFVILDVYSLKEGKETFESSIRMDTNPFNNWFYKELAFYKEGDFIIYIYDEKDQMVGVGQVKLMFK